jgi:2-polyprenyl-6-hydroxyphenyl methylase / 3-demethylubiquinone-9 3-methyltransferase
VTQGRTINPSEAAHFGALAADWWDPNGSSAMLHKLNPVRLRYIREQVDAHWGLDPRTVRPLACKKALDVGCGAGLLCEPLARLGASVTGIDAAPENIAVAGDHAAGQGLSINYHAGELESLDGSFDLVTSMEVIEHVTNPATFVAALAARIAPGGLLILSTPNRTGFSRVAMITVGEGLGMIPKGTHDWDKFLTPEELRVILTGAGLKLIDMRGIGFSPISGLTLSHDTRLNYILSAIRV